MLPRGGRRWMGVSPNFPASATYWNTRFTPEQCVRRRTRCGAKSEAIAARGNSITRPHREYSGCVRMPRSWPTWSELSVVSGLWGSWWRRIMKGDYEKPQFKDDVQRRIEKPQTVGEGLHAGPFEYETGIALRRNHSLIALHCAALHDSAARMVRQDGAMVPRDGVVAGRRKRAHQTAYSIPRGSSALAAIISTGSLLLMVARPFAAAIGNAPIYYLSPYTSRSEVGGSGTRSSIDIQPRARAID